MWKPFDYGKEEILDGSDLRIPQSVPDPQIGMKPYDKNVIHAGLCGSIYFC